MEIKRVTIAHVWVVYFALVQCVTDFTINQNTVVFKFIVYYFVIEVI